MPIFDFTQKDSIPGVVGFVRRARRAAGRFGGSVFIAPGEVQMVLVSSIPTVFAPSVTVGSVTVVLPLVSTAPTVYSPAVSSALNVVLPLVTVPDPTVYSPAVTNALVPSFVAATNASALVAASTGVTVSKPTGVADGDVLYAFVAKNTYADTNAFTCSGWTALANVSIGSVTENDRHTVILRKVITNAAGEASTYTFVTTSGTTSGMIGIIVCVRGLDTSTPEDVSPTTSHRVFAVNDATPASTDITTVTPNAFVMQYCLLALGVAGQKTWGPPSGYTQNANATAGETTSATLKMQAGVAYKTQASPGAVGTNVWTHTADDSLTDTVATVIVGRPGRA